MNSTITSGETDQTVYYPRYSFSGYTRAGTYTGIGTAISPVRSQPARKKVR